jgi:hypothetical protein
MPERDRATALRLAEEGARLGPHDPSAVTRFGLGHCPTSVLVCARDVIE